MTAIKQLSIATTGAALIILGIGLENQQAQAADIIQDLSTGTTQINFSSPIGQTFTAEDSSIQSIGFYLKDFNPQLAPNDFSVAIKLYQGNGTNGTFLGSGVYNHLSNGFQGYADVDFSSVHLTVGNIYTAIVQDTTPRWGVDIYSTFNSPSPYLGGNAIISNNSAPSSDLRFRVLAAKSVPEPTPLLGLFAFGALGAGALLKRKSPALSK